MEELGLRESIEVLLKRKKMIISITLFTVLTSAIISFFILEPVYETRMVLMASNFSDRLQPSQLKGEGIDNILSNLSQYPSMTMETYKEQVKAPRVMRETIAELGLEDQYDIESLAKAITLETIQDTNLLNIKMRAEDPELAAKIVNTVGQKFVAFVSDKAKEQATTTSQYIGTQIDVEKEKLQYRKDLEEARKLSSSVKEIKESKFDILGFVIACTFGYIIGNINIYLPLVGYFSLGSTGGVLIGALILGYIGKIGSVSFRMDSKILGIIRDLALAFFLAIVGLRYGYKAVDALVGAGAYLGVISLAVGIVGMLSGFLIGRYVLKINWVMLSGAICGGMTSTPGLGAAVEALGSDEPAGGYAATYPFALLGMVIFTIILHKMPM